MTLFPSPLCRGVEECSCIILPGGLLLLLQGLLITLQSCGQTMATPPPPLFLGPGLHTCPKVMGRALSLPELEPAIRCPTVVDLRTS